MLERGEGGLEHGERSPSRSPAQPTGSIGRGDRRLPLPGGSDYPADGGEDRVVETPSPADEAEERANPDDGSCGLVGLRVALPSKCEHEDRDPHPERHGREGDGDAQAGPSPDERRADARAPVTRIPTGAKSAL